MNDTTSLLDDDHTRCLCDVGGRGYIATAAVSADGSTHLLLALVDAIGDERVSTTHLSRHSTRTARPVAPRLRAPRHDQPAHPPLWPPHQDHRPPMPNQSHPFRRHVRLAPHRSETRMSHIRPVDESRAARIVLAYLDNEVDRVNPATADAKDSIHLLIAAMVTHLVLAARAPSMSEQQLAGNVGVRDPDRQRR